jgi:membrane protease YdiL (CAAX protease family)
MKKTFFQLILFLLMGYLIFSNSLLPILSLFIKIHFNLGISHYIFVITSYFCIALVLWFEQNNLEEFNLDRISIFLLIIVGFTRSQFNIPMEIYFKIPIYLLNIGILISLILHYQKIPKTKWRWILIGLFSCLIIIPISLINSLQGQTDSDLSLIGNGFFVNFARNLVYSLSFVAPFEEIVIRGILWGQLRRWGWSINQVFWVQALIFWLLHIGQLFTMPLAFLITLPIMTLILSLLVRYSKQVFPSILVHTVANALGPLIVYFFL